GASEVVFGEQPGGSSGGWVVTTERAEAAAAIPHDAGRARGDVRGNLVDHRRRLPAYRGVSAQNDLPGRAQDGSEIPENGGSRLCRGRGCLQDPAIGRREPAGGST